MENNDDVIRVLNHEECIERLNRVHLGRVVVRRSDDMDIFPVNFVVDDGQIYFRTAEGSKLFTIELNHDVLFEADEVVDGRAWSVVVKGEAGLLKGNADIQHADTLPLKPWLPTLKYNYVRITPGEINGREFRLGEEPERY
ncbi:pyridoxamine 5'-phosphate oxidase family protein [Corynebacterium pygosceleis]|uniref:Pyridoxamine 5'-phosphate oxidase family protein n=1 Tax=Corynebacterium pygosceleis TaxID=2800406 RepID=A0A9Q4C9D7_9CORY|nr:pyridoxamine 5'-phosphate oxidase family protein [Corynebacterium pygosceleis]MCK7638556.1 pyridoxamine 5'-phosphate oxidase family protein [Corynebacterium pygosceleis]MCK7676334.1 pyridoxamine 5'-phosphate oxidase family protein [Corynebacterium pygosceleis]MCL0121507.1 pyridoxamine 5'-phosphate oxidase family protein [Corynebacterium pygosceleis]MCX7469301.1 pyridoxamine 5'-phosphate oxidase family protein [Corynebacterium pygosceleis]